MNKIKEYTEKIFEDIKRIDVIYFLKCPIFENAFLS